MVGKGKKTRNNVDILIIKQEIKNTSVRRRLPLTLDLKNTGLEEASWQGCVGKDIGIMSRCIPRDIYSTHALLFHTHTL